MIDWQKITGFDWDEGNNRKNVDSHSVSCNEAEQIFFNQPLLVKDDVKHRDQEQRWHALGLTDAMRLLHISFTLRAFDRKIRIISARDMHRKERVFYEQQI